MHPQKIIGPFAQVVTMRGLPSHGKIADEQLEIIYNGGVLLEQKKIIAVGVYNQLCIDFPNAFIETQDEKDRNSVLIPGFVDAHTHICFDGSRARDYSLRVAGKSYLEIAKAGGGIWDTVTKTRTASEARLIERTAKRANDLLNQGVTTIEVKSGYGLSIEEELKMLRAIEKAKNFTAATLISTCLAAHMKPKDFEGSSSEYLKLIREKLFPILKEEKLTNRIDIFIEDSAFSPDEAREFLQHAKNAGFDLTVHADQFTSGGSEIAVEFGALSADHLESSTDIDVARFANAETVAVALPGASLGLGMKFTPARKLLDAGASLAIASDWNPGSAPMGDLLTQAAVLGAFEKLTIAETLAGLTIRAAKALGLNDRGSIDTNQTADFQLYDTDDYREIFYLQGRLKPYKVWKNGKINKY
jgi:imidazolonepropionase